MRPSLKQDMARARATMEEFIREKMDLEGLKERLLNCVKKRNAVKKRLSEVRGLQAIGLGAKS